MRKRRLSQLIQPEAALPPLPESGADAACEAGLQRLLTLWGIRSLIHAGGLDHLLGSSEAGERLRALGVEASEDMPEGTRGANAAGKAALVRQLRAREAVLEDELEGFDLRAFEGPRTLGEKLALRNDELLVTAFVAEISNRSQFAAQFDDFGELSTQQFFRLLAWVLALPLQRVRKIFSPTAPLVASGIVTVDQRGYALAHKVDVLSGLHEALVGGPDGVDRFLRAFYTVAPAPLLSASDYRHVEADWRLIARLIEEAVRRQLPGINVLLHGEPGTGKTEMVRALAAAAGVLLYEVTTEDEDGDPQGSGNRLRGLQVAHRVLANGSGGLVLFDEAEDALPGRTLTLFGPMQREERTKGWFTRLLERNPVPTIWISNRVAGVDAAYLRRFTYVCELRSPPAPVRRSMLERAFQGLPVTEGWLAKAARCERLSPAHIARAARVLELVCAGEPEADAVEADLDRIVGNSLGAAGIGWTYGAEPASPVRYDLGLLNTDADVHALARGLREGEPAARICLYGPPGTGKTELARHLAEVLARPLLALKMSDLLRPYLGETEALVAKTFAEAADRGAVLLLDEADGLLRERRDAIRSWEVTQTNELLVQMEAFHGLFLCATNLFENLDAASLRRFDLKIRFDYLRPEQAWALFRQLAGQRGLPADRLPAEAVRVLGTLDNLTPGDFAAVARRLRFLPGAVDAAAVLGELEKEARAKAHGAGRPIGFTAAV